MANSETAAATPSGAGAKSMRSLSSLETGSYWRFFGELALLYIYSSEWDGFWGSKFTIRMLGRPFFYHYSLNMSLIGLTQICGNNSDWSVTIAQICGKALIGLLQCLHLGNRIFRIFRGPCHRFVQFWQTKSFSTYLALFNFGALYKWVVAHLSETIPNGLNRLILNCAKNAYLFFGKMIFS